MIIRPTIRPTASDDGILTDTLTSVVLIDLPPRSPVIFIVGSTSDPNVQGQPSQDGPDAWNMKIQDYLKYNILPEETCIH
jgi:hypothetical protein